MCVNILEARDAKYTMTELSKYRVKYLWLWKFLFVSMAPVGGEHEQVPGWYSKTLKERKRRDNDALMLLFYDQRTLIMCVSVTFLVIMPGECIRMVSITHLLVKNFLK